MMKSRIAAWLITCTLLAACATTPSGSTAPAPSTQTPLSVTRSSTPTARVLTRADQPGNADSQPLPQDHNESGSGTPVPDHADAINALPRVGQRAPDFTLKTLGGSSISLSQFRGKAVLINFWTSWCTACREESPLLESFYQTHQSDGLVVLGMNVTSQDTPDAASAYVKEMKLTFPIPLDVHGAVSDNYHVPGLPVSFFVDTQGIIRNIIVGQMQSDDLAEGLRLMGVQ
jgi:cytochrome c biogenesis protein CcmG, thiol:disulfide interchange protein DsbE